MVSVEWGDASLVFADVFHPVVSGDTRVVQISRCRSFQKDKVCLQVFLMDVRVDRGAKGVVKDYSNDTYLIRLLRLDTTGTCSSSMVWEVPFAKTNSDRLTEDQITTRIDRFNGCFELKILVIPAAIMTDGSLSMERLVGSPFWGNCVHGSVKCNYALWFLHILDLQNGLMEAENTEFSCGYKRPKCLCVSSTAFVVMTSQWFCR